jgi:hypothetical protein
MLSPACLLRACASSSSSSATVDDTNASHMDLWRYSDSRWTGHVIRSQVSEAEDGQVHALRKL